MKYAINELEHALDTVTTNEPINRAEGNIAQANLELAVAADIKQALSILENAKNG